MNTFILILSLVAGVIGTGFGGILGVLFKNKGAKAMGRVLSFAGGVMVGVVAFEMLPESMEAMTSLGKVGGVALSVATLVGGMVIIYAVNKFLDFIEHKKRAMQNDVYRSSAVVQAHAHCYLSANSSSAIRFGIAKPSANSGGANRENASRSGKVEITSNKRVKTLRRVEGVRVENLSNNRRELIKAGTVMLIAIALHNFPEGMAIGATGAVQTKMGALVALIIAVHNIPEGMAIAAPLVSGGVHGVKAVLLTALAGGATVLGALVGLAIGGLGDIATGVCMSLAGGAMLYVTFLEILPQSILLDDGAVPAASMLVGIVCAAVFVYAF